MMSGDLVEYAGFRYRIKKVGDFLVAEPEPGQHRAAAKEKHCRAALEQYQEENSRSGGEA